MLFHPYEFKLRRLLHACYFIKLIPTYPPILHVHAKRWLWYLPATFSPKLNSLIWPIHTGAFVGCSSVKSMGKADYVASSNHPLCALLHRGSPRNNFDGLVQERCNSNALAIKSCLSFTNPPIWKCSWSRQTRCFLSMAGQKTQPTKEDVTYVTFYVMG